MIKTALRGYVCENYSGEKSRIYRSARSAKLVCFFLGCGWYVREVKDLALIC